MMGVAWALALHRDSTQAEYYLNFRESRPCSPGMRLDIFCDANRCRAVATEDVDLPLWKITTIPSITADRPVCVMRQMIVMNRVDAGPACWGALRPPILPHCSPQGRSGGYFICFCLE